MIDLAEAIEAIKISCSESKEFADILRDHSDITRTDLEGLAEFSPKVRLALVNLDVFFTSAKAVKTVILRKEGIKVTNTGKFYRMNGEEITPVWYDGELRLLLGDDIKRCSTLVVVAFGIKSEDRDSMMNIDYRDGDRRNLAPENLYWTKPYNADYKLLLVEDICRRIIQFKGDVDLILEQYVGSVPSVGRKYVESIINKEAFKDVSDNYFHTDSDGNIVSLLLDTSENSGMDCFGLLVNTKDRGLVESLLASKVEMNQRLSMSEMEIVCVSVKCPDDNITSETIMNKYGLNILPEQIKSILNNKSSHTLETIKEIYGGENNG